ncbi:MAG: hypothetical protein GXO78_03785 [Calditrichaeota bacterium]|nr:hypothetical protein [Calditrichota bacterium]
MHIKPLYKIYLVTFLISVFFTIGIAFAIKRYFTPIRFIENRGTKYKPDQEKVYFFDLDGDGYHERVMLINNHPKRNYYIKIYKDFLSGIIDQFNFKHPLALDYLSFSDVNDDNWAEIFAFSHNNDSLFLSIIDVRRLTFRIKERPIFACGRDSLNRSWDITRVYAHYLDINRDNRPELLIALNTGFRLTPRVVFIYDLQDRRITHQFVHHMGYVDTRVQDLNGDGYPEIALRNSSTNNFKKPVPLSDQYSWLVMLDNRLQPLFPPQKLGTAFTNVEVLTLPKIQPSCFLFWIQSDNNSVQLRDIRGRVVAQRKFTSNILSVKSDTSGIYLTVAQDSIYFLDGWLQIVRRGRISGSQSLVIEGVFQFQSRKLIIARDDRFVYLLNPKFKVQAIHPFPSKETLLSIEVIQTAGYPGPTLAATFTSQIFYLNVLQNPRAWLFWPTVLLMFGVFQSLLLMIHWILNRIRQYTSYFIYSLHRSRNAIILLDHRGKVITFNQHINQFLNLSPPLKTRQSFQEGLRSRPEVVAAIQQCMRDRQQISTSFVIEDAHDTFIGEVTVTPFHSFFHFINAYLVEIKDSTQQVLHERQLNWQKNIRRIVHDLKTPLAGVQIKLQSIYLRLREAHPEVVGEVQNELEAAHSELLRIRNISRDFLKFSALAELNLEKVELEPFIQRCIEPFLLYTSDQLTLHLELAEDLPTFVCWDARQIELALHSIVENSLDALHGKGEIQIQVYPSPKKKGQIEIKIVDNGEGIPEAYKDRIFEPHFSTKKEGSGLGLAFAKQIVLQHGGSIEFNSIRLTGTIFVLKLPVQAKTV